MLSSIRKFSNSIFAKIFLFIVAIPFVFWGMGDLFSGGSQNTIVKIGKQKIHTDEFANFIRNYLTPDQTVDDKFVDRVFSIFIGNKLINYEVEDYEIKLSNSSLSRIIKNDNAFKKENKFSRTEYEKFLVKNSINAAIYEKNILEIEKKKQLLDLISGGIVPSAFLIDQDFNKINQKRNIQIINLNKAYAKETTFSDQQIQNYYSKNKEKFKNIFKSIKFIKLSSKNLTNNEEYTDLFFKKIDEIDDLIVEGKNLNFITKEYNLDIPLEIVTNKNGLNQKGEKINNFPIGLLDNVFNINNEERTALMLNEDKYYIVELINTETTFEDLSKTSVKKVVIENLEKETRKKLIAELISQINNNIFDKAKFDKFSKDKSVEVKKIKLNNKNDDAILKKEIVNNIYSFPEKRVFALTDIFLTESYLVYVDKIENVSINLNNKENEKYLISSKARLTNSLFNTYDTYLKNKYNIDVNNNALDAIKNNIK